MRSIQKDTFREIKGTLGRFFSIVMLITLGVAFFVGIRVTSIDMRHTADTYLDDTNFMDFRLISTVGFQEEDLTEIARLGDISEISPVKQMDTLVNISDRDLVVRLIGMDTKIFTNNKKTINQPVLVDGRMPRAENEVVLDERGRSVFQVQMGDTLALKSDTNEDLSEKLTETKFKVVGFVKTPMYLSVERGTSTIGNGKLEFFLLGDDSLFKDEIWHEVYVTAKEGKDLQTFSSDYEKTLNPIQTELEAIGEQQSEKFYQENVEDVKADLDKKEKELLQKEKDALQKIDLALQSGLAQNPMQKVQLEAQKEAIQQEFVKGKATIQEARAKLDEIPTAEWFVLDRKQNAGYVEFQDSTNSIEGLAAVFPIFLFLVAALVSLTTMTRMVGEQRGYIGTLKALGYGKFPIAMKYITYSVCATLIGSLFGSFIGTYLLPRAVYTPYQNMFSTPQLMLGFDWLNVLVATGIALLFTVIPTVFSCMKELQENASSLLRPKAPSIGKKILLERMPLIWKKFSFIYKVTLRNIFRYKKRFIMTVFGISGCTALLVLGFGIKDSIGSIITEQYDRIYQYDMAVSVADTVNTDTFTLTGEKGIKNELYVHQQTVDISYGQVKKSIVMTVPKKASKLKDYILLQTRTGKKPLELTDEGILLTEKMAKILGVKTNEEITLQVSDTQTKKVKVLGITENYFYHHLYITPALYQQLFQEKPIYDTMFVQVEESKIGDEEKFVQSLMKKAEVDSCNFLSSSSETMDHLMESLNGVVMILIFSAGLLAFVVLYNLTNVNISERIREIATIKVLGFYNHEVSKYIFRENMILTVLGTLIGLGLGVVLHNYTLHATEMDYTMFPRMIHFISFIYSAILTIGFSLLVNFVMYFKLKAVNMVESLKSVE